MKCSCWSSPQKNTRAMFSWSSLAALRASWWKRRTFSGSAAVAGGRILRATKRSSWVSRARRTAAIPPTPIGSISSK
ncbi:MAG: hypothetical protein U0736_10880 [Gemmataceae bacterium]